MITSLQTQVVDDEAKDENEEDDLEELEINEPENNIGKFGMQIQDRYEDI